jgi:trk/ktr system potassium uptake protein
MSPPLVLAATLVTTILVGAVFLAIPPSHAAAPVGFLDALFTATSAVCVTGLTVVDTGTSYSFFGQVVILLLIQVGGLGIMTISTLVFLAFGGGGASVVRATLRGLATHRPALRARDLIGTVFVATLSVELVGAALLFFAFLGDYPPTRALWLAVFHSVSAFCNAGFGLMADSLVRYVGDPLVNFTVMGLIVAGGVGFVVLVELRLWALSYLRGGGRIEKLSLHSRVVLTATAVAIFGGALLIVGLEARNVLSGRPWGERALIATFQSVTARTAGFNTIDIGALANPSLLVLILLMFVGAGPGSMAGGIKLTSAAAVLALVYHRLRGNREVRMFRRGIGEATLQRAVVLSILSALMIGLTVCLVEIFQGGGTPTPSGRGEFLEVTFEAVSAFGTVGLSMGLTPQLVSGSKLIIILLMLVGRLGPLWLMDFLAQLPAAPPIRHAKEELMVG